MRYTRRNIKYNTNAGFTLVEMIVVLVILGILASVAVYSIIGYINRTRYNNNQQNAESIYQSAQATLNHMSENGTINDWAKSLIGSKGMTGADGSENGIGVPDGYNPSNVDIPGSLDNTYNQRFFETLQDKTDKMPGQSAHMRYAVTYTPVDDSLKDQNDFIWELLSPDFKSTDIFSGIITIEFDVEKVLDSTNTPRYSASVYSVFYDSRSSSWDTSSHKWNSTALKSYSTSEDGSSANNSPVPYRSEDYRSSTSLVGYYAGRGIMSAVDSVYLPPEAKINNFTLRNGETLDLNWSLTSEDGTPITGIPSHIHYTFSLYDEAGKDTYPANKICDIVVNENSILEGIPNRSLYADKVTVDDKVSYPNSIYNKFESLFESKFQDASDKTLFNESLFVSGAVENIKLNTPTRMGDNNGRTYTIVYSRDYITDVSGIEMTVYKASFMTNTDVYVHMVAADNNYAFDCNKPEANILGESNYYRFPLTVTYECYVIKNSGQNNNQNYGTIISKGITYSLSLDAMMSRNVIDSIDDNSTSASAEKTVNYSINRLLNKTATYIKYDIMPANIYAEMVVDNDADFEENYNKDYEGYSLQEQVKASAQRAYNDPVYLRADGKYYYEKNKAGYDTAEHAVVNSYFGDLDEGSFGTHPNVTGTEKAVITSFRHLYNIRMLESYNVDICYYIKRDLNWFTIKKDEETGKETYSSDVIVFSPINDTVITNLRALESSKGSDEIAINEHYDNADHSGLHAFSPVPVPAITPTNPYPHYGDTLNVVSFPTIKKLIKKTTIVAVDNSLAVKADDEDDITSVINNVQMRNASFYDKDDVSNALNAYGLININYGTVINLRVNCTTLVLNNMRDGSPDDRDDIAEGINQLLTSSVGTDEAYLGTSPASAIIGANGGNVGDKDNVYKTPNITRASNCIVTSLHRTAEGWKLYKVSAVSCVIGDHGVSQPSKVDGYAYGQIEATGHFACAGWINIAGAIGYARSNIDATILIDNTIVDNDTLYIDFGSVNNNDQKPINSVIYATADSAGGALGKMEEKRHFYQNVSSLNYVDLGNGRFELTEASDAVYAISVNLDSGSYIVIRDKSDPKKDEKNSGVGGAIGRMTCSGTLSILVINDGTISTSNQNGNHQYVQNLGGAIGTLYSSNISGMNIYVVNNGNLGSYGDENPDICSNSTGGAIGRIQSTTTDGSDINISVINNGNIYGDFSHYNSVGDNGVGGAIGSLIGDYTNLTNYNVRCENNGKIYGTTRQLYTNGNKIPNSDNSFGIGGVIGYAQFIPHSSAIYSILESDASVSSSGNNAGGAIGSISGKPGDIDYSQTTITADLHDNCSITALGCNAGGTVGNFGEFYGNTTIRSKILDGTNGVNIEALCDAGGVCGRVRTTTSTAFASIILEGSNNSLINILASGLSDSNYKNNAGGLIGVCHIDGGSTSGSGFSAKLILPTQTVGNILRVNVDSKYDNAGGVIGYFLNNKQNTSITDASSNGMTVTLHPESHVYSLHDNAGGCFGLFETDKEINSNIFVNTSSITSNSVPYIWADNENAGGVIGKCTKPTFNYTYSICLTSNNGIKIKGGSYDAANNKIIGGNTGGCIGNINSSAALNGSILIEGTYIEISGFKNTGGVIGTCNSPTIGTTGKIINNANDIYISGPDSTGGVIGNCSSTTISESAIISTNAKKITVTGRNNIGGVIGMCKSTSINKSAVISITSNEANIKFDTDKYTDTENDTGIGGVIGKCLSTTVSESALILNNAPVTNVTGLNNIGGVIGLCSKSTISGFVTYGIVVDTDGNRSTNVIAVNVSGQENTGGVVGNCSESTLLGTISYNVIIPNLLTKTVEGITNTGGCIGRLYKGQTSASSTIEFAGVNSEIYGTTYTGGCIGYAENITDNNGIHGTIRFSGSSNKITGTSNYTGGIAGGMSSCTTKDNASFIYSGVNSPIEGTKYTGGVIGRIYQGTYNDNSSFIYNGTNSNIVGNNNDFIGGISGETYQGNYNNNTSITYTAKNSSIFGYDYTGGLIGRMDGTKINNNSALTFSGTNDSLTTSINGHNYTGGVVGGMVSSTTTNSETTLTFSGKNVSIKGNENVGGVIGSTNGCTNYSIIKFSPLSSCSIIGESGNVGGCVGLGSGGSHNLDCKLYIDISKNLEIKGAGYTGGIIGRLQSGCWYSRSYITVKGDDTVFTVKSTGSSAGGHIGYMTGCNLGGGGDLRITCEGKSKINITGSNAAGGFIGYIEKENKTNTPTMTISLSDASSEINIDVSGSKAGAGGIIGYNGSTFGKSNDIIFSGNGTVSVSAPSGYVGAYIGINKGSYKGDTATSYETYINHITFGNHIGDLSNVLVGTTNP